MSDRSNSSGSSGSSTNSWTLISPEEAAVENVGPVDDGTESLGDAPSLSEEVSGAASEYKPAEMSIETILSEEGHEVCQETSPESGEGPIPSSPSRLSPLLPSTLDPSSLDPESQPPVIHDIVTTSPSDNETQGAMPFITNIDLGVPLDLPHVEIPPADPTEAVAATPMGEIDLPHVEVPPADPTEAVAATPMGEIDLPHVEVPPADPTEAVAATPMDEIDLPHVEIPPADPTKAVSATHMSESDTPARLLSSSPAEEDEIRSAEREVNVSTETLTAADLPPHIAPDIALATESPKPPSPVPEELEEEIPPSEGPTPETLGSAEAEEEEFAAENEEEQPSETSNLQEEEEQDEEPSSSFERGDSGSFDGLRRRIVPPFDAPRPRTSDEEDEEEEVEFKLEEKKEEKPWLSVNKCIVAAAVLLFLGSLFLSGEFDVSDLSDGDQSQEWPSSDPQEMKEMLDKLTQENQQITQLEVQLQTKKEELDSEMKAVAAGVDEKAKYDLEMEDTKLKEELSSLPKLKKELESLRARVTELSQLTAKSDAPSSASSPASQSKKFPKAAGPERWKETDGDGKLKEELRRQKVLLEESKKRLDGMRSSGGGGKHVWESLEGIQRKLSEQVESWEKKKRPQESKWSGKKGRTNEQEQWKKEGKREEWKPRKDNSHKEAWRRNQAEWEQKKGERRMDREDRRKAKPWHSRQAKPAQPPPRQNNQQHHSDFWRDQELKLNRNVRPQLGCASVEDCAAREGLYPVELSEFEELLEGYLSKLESPPAGSKDKIRQLAAGFFEDGVFIHDRVRFGDFAEDVADILEDMVDVLEAGGQKHSESLEEEMEEFEREALWKFAA